jgi:CDP-diacylglycerol---glycerol-3-phosphate 3-phosphatidyltransferase
MNEFATFPNFLSLIRVPLAMLLFVESPFIRALAILLAAASDFLDGFLARKVFRVTRVGTYLDPLTDKLFVFIALFIFFFEGRLTTLQLGAFFIRDISVFVFTLFLFCTDNMRRFRVQSFFCGKITTALQFMILFSLAISIQLDALFYEGLAFFGILSLIELFVRWKLQSSQTVSEQ